ncbi:BTAD domain-containing putative transcriptional regulator [Kitasatospora sp. NPDC089509]|uniref:BTAD domain-containing putative transcriptional regulator n=1 Tax=Kitasatospora sp. NPDC089509 TaxID=3364079 RepID=UPI0038289B49
MTNDGITNDGMTNGSPTSDGPTGDGATGYPCTLRFNVLGPLEVLRHGTPQPLSGVNQRAVLGYLLLRHNQVTATSQLISSLWEGPPPSSARKMVQNAVWHLRNLLQTDPLHPGPDAVVLRSRAPGYVLEVEPRTIDLHHFQELVATGRARMRDGAVAAAAQRWREALGLWRGPALSDLAEAGMGLAWPELAAAETARLDVLEELFDAELALGRQQAVLPELQELSRAHPRRERLAGQLMLALHRSGRQSDALGVYQSVRAHLAEELGLDPGRDLQSVQQAILTDDPALEYTPLPGGARVGCAATTRGGPPPGPSGGPGPTDGPAAVGAPGPGGDAEELVQERREVTVVLLNASVPAEHPGGDPEHLDRVMTELHELVRSEAQRFGGTLAARIGSSWLVLFGAQRIRSNEAMRAVLMALAVRHRLRFRYADADGLALRAAVDTGEALVRYGPDAPGVPSVTGAAVDRPLSLLPLVPRDQVWVSEPTREQTDNWIEYRRASVHSPIWTVTGLRSNGVRDEGSPVLERAGETAMMADLLTAGADTPATPNSPDGRTGPRMLLVVGEAGMGKSAMIDEFERLAARQEPAVRPLVAHIVPCAVDDSPLRFVAAELSAGCGIRPDDPPETARAKLWATVDRVAADPAEARQLFEQLVVPIGHVPAHERTAGPEEVTAAWHTLLERLAAERPVVMVVDDLHSADEPLLDTVDRLVRSPCPSRLLVVATARPELFARRPDWQGAAGALRTVTLAPLSDAAVGRLARSVIAAQHPADPPPGLVRELVAAVTDLADGNPLFVTEFVRLALRRLDATEPAPRHGALGEVPMAVRRVLSARLDALPANLKAVLQDAAVLGGGIRPDAVAALRRERTDEVNGALDTLARLGILGPAPADADGTSRFAFRQPLLCEVAYARIPRGQRVEKRAAVTGWSKRARVPDGPRPVAPELLRLRAAVRQLCV